MKRLPAAAQLCRLGCREGLNQQWVNTGRYWLLSCLAFYPDCLGWTSGRSTPVSYLVYKIRLLTKRDKAQELKTLMEAKTQHTGPWSSQRPSAYGSPLVEFSREQLCQGIMYTSLIPALRWQKPEDHYKFKSSQVYLASSRLARVMQQYHDNVKYVHSDQVTGHKLLSSMHFIQGCCLPSDEKPMPPLAYDRSF